MRQPLALVLLDQLDRERLPAFALAVAIIGIILLVILVAAGLPAEEFVPA